MSAGGRVFIGVVSVSAVFAACSAGPSFARTTARQTQPVQVAASVVVGQGDEARIAMPDPLTSIQDLHAQNDKGSPVALSHRVVASPNGSELFVDAGSAAPLGARTLPLTGAGCTASGCGEPFVLLLRVVVVSPVPLPNVPLTMTDPSAERVAQGIPQATGGVILSDELLVGLGTDEMPGTRTDAEAIAATVGAVVVGGTEDTGIYQLRWPQPQDLAARTAQLSALPGVAFVSPSDHGTVSVTAEPPGDWNDDGPEATWPFTMIHAQSAWDSTTGGNVKVGILDGDSVFAGHEDLNVSDLLDKGPLSGMHATHVAGLACAKANGIGLVGVAWGCPIASAADGDGSNRAVESSAIDLIEAGAKVINISLGATSGCLGPARAVQQKADLSRYAPMFRRLFSRFSNIVWTLAAGNNCADGPASAMALGGAGLDNVLVVAAANSDGNLASFSNFGSGVNVAAPGGWDVPGDSGIWSTVWKWCGFFGTSRCSSYGTMVGTSMAAPIVAGVAALVRAAHPSFTGMQVGRCITQTAGDGTGSVTRRDDQPSGGNYPLIGYSGTLPIVNAAAAVQCASVPPPPPPPPPADAVQTWPVPGDNSWAWKMAIGSDGAIWFTRGPNNGPEIGRIDLVSHAVSNYPLPNSAGATGITEGPDGALWIINQLNGGGEDIVRMTTSGATTEFSGGASYMTDITTGPDGALWATGDAGVNVSGCGDCYGAIFRITTSGQITKYQLQNIAEWPDTIACGQPGSNTLWFTASGLGTAAGPAPNHEIGEITTSGDITEFGLSADAGPWTIAAGADGNMWLTDFNAIDKITPGGTLTQFPTPAPLNSFAPLVRGSNGNLWAVDANGRLLEITPVGGIVEAPYFSTGPIYTNTAIVGPDGAVWFFGQGTVGRFALPG